MTDYFISFLGRRYAIRQEPLAVGSNLYLGHSYETAQELSFMFKRVVVQKQSESEPPTQKQILKHENVLHFSDWIDCKPDMERYLIYPTFGVSCMSLSDYVKNRGQSTDFRVLIRGLLKGLTHCHRRGIAHGKVEPSTLLIEQIENQPCPTLILTYDLSRELTNPLHEIAPGLYSPPEVWLPVPLEYEPVSLRSVDSWTCGCVLAYMYTGGYHLFEWTGGIENIKAKKDSHLSLPVPLPHPQRRDLICPEDAMNLLDGFLVFDPKTRLEVIDACNMFKLNRGSVPTIIAPEPKEKQHPDITAHFPVGDNNFIDFF